MGEMVAKERQQRCHHNMKSRVETDVARQGGQTTGLDWNK